jgi:hypothetical protein
MQIKQFVSRIRRAQMVVERKKYELTASMSNVRKAGILTDR